MYSPSCGPELHCVSWACFTFICRHLPIERLKSYSPLWQSRPWNCWGRTFPKSNFVVGVNLLYPNDNFILQMQERKTRRKRQRTGVYLKILVSLDICFWMRLVLNCFPQSNNRIRPYTDNSSRIGDNAWRDSTRFRAIYFSHQKTVLVLFLLSQRCCATWRVLYTLFVVVLVLQT